MIAVKGKEHENHSGEGMGYSPELNGLYNQETRAAPTPGTSLDGVATSSHKGVSVGKEPRKP